MICFVVVVVFGQNNYFKSKNDKIKSKKFQLKDKIVRYNSKLWNKVKEEKVKVIS